MKYERVKCDICQKADLKESIDCVHLEIPTHRGWDGIENVTDYEFYDICVDCMESFFKYKLLKKNSFETNKEICAMLDVMKKGKEIG